MTSTDIQVEGLTKGYGERPVSRRLAASVASGEDFGGLGPAAAGTTTAVENVPGWRHQDGRRIPVGGFAPAEPRGQMRHLVIFPAPVL
jgi:ABC-type lipopolysaccharide export system ATPase subunit